MYMGFMKQGVSIMCAFFLFIFLGDWLNIGALLYALPVLWFYSFFDGINKMSMDDEDFYCLEDRYLFIEKLDFESLSRFVKKNNILIAVLLILIGGSSLFNVFVELIGRLINFYYINELARFVRWFVPQTVFALFIIWLGVKLINGKKKSLEDKKEF